VVRKRLTNKFGGKKKKVNKEKEKGSRVLNKAQENEGP